MKSLRLIALQALILPASALAQISPPAVVSVKPAWAAPGETVKLTIEGKELDRTSGLIFDDSRHASIGVGVESSGRDRVVATLVLSKDLPPGPMGFRVVSPRGLSAPAQLDIGRTGPRVAEVEPNDGFRKPQVVSIPCTVEGVISPAHDVDLFAVDMKAGETLVAEVVAERVGSTLDSSLTIFDTHGRELTTVDDLFGHDAAAWARAAQSGRYFVQVIDANGRNPDGMIEAKLQGHRTYRLSLGTIPLITTVDPPGVRRGIPTRLRLLGANLPAESIFLAPPSSPPGDFAFSSGGSNPINLRVGDVPETREIEPDDRVDQAIAVTVPAAIHGLFEPKPGGDVDFYRIKPAEGRVGDHAITVFARRIGSPADPVLAVLGDDAKSLAEDDDKLGRDARIERRIEPGGLLIGVREFYGRGGERFVYRIEVEPVPRARINVALGGRSVPKKGRVALDIEVERHGYDGPIAILPGPLPTGLTGPPMTIPGGINRGMLVIAADDQAKLGTFRLKLTAPDVRDSLGWTFSERLSTGKVLTPSILPVAGAMIAIAEPAALDLAIEPREIDLKPGGEAVLRIKLDRRDDAAKGPVVVTLHPADGAFEPVKGVSLAAGVGTGEFRLKAKSDAAPRRFMAAARARFEAMPEGSDIASNPVAIEVRGREK